MSKNGDASGAASGDERLPDDPERVRELAAVGQRALRILAEMDANARERQRNDQAADAEKRERTAAEAEAKRKAKPSSSDVTRVAHRLNDVIVCFVSSG